MDIGKSEYFQICSQTWKFFKESLPIRNDQAYWNDVLHRGEAIIKAYKGTTYYDFASAQLASYINEIDRLSRKGTKGTV